MLVKVNVECLTRDICISYAYVAERRSAGVSSLDFFACMHQTILYGEGTSRALHVPSGELRFPR